MAKSNPVASVLKWFLLIFLLCITLLPLVWTLGSSFKTNEELWSSSFSMPKTLNFQNYAKALRLDGFFRAFLNTIAVTSLATVTVSFIGSMASYALLERFIGSNVIYAILIAGIYIPIITFMLPYYMIARWLKLFDTLYILIIIYSAIGLPLTFLIIRNYMTTIPREIEESAVMDGCSYPRRYWSIILPLIGPGLMAASIFNFVAFWNEFFYASLLTVDKAARTLQVSMRFFAGAFVNDYAALFATLVLSIMPTIIVYILFQDRIISGLTSGAVKG